jgi:pimeloyl-ACP methyl ester carboxylesterase
MKLFFKKTGEGKPLIILHGLFGLNDNWATLSKSYVAAGYTVYAVDQRNHGRSEHSMDFSYQAMATDLFELMNDEGLSSADFIGHSMGGKTVMQFALQYESMIRKMIVADIGPGYYPQHHQSVFAALNAIDFNEVKTRKEAEAILRLSLKDEGTIQFLLKNLYWKTELDWRFGLKEIQANIEEIGKALPGNEKINVETLFLRGERSGYISQSQIEMIEERFTNAEIQTVPNAGHWVHAENPAAFFEQTINFLNA